MNRFINRNFSLCIYVFYVLMLLTILFQLRSYGLLPMPEQGTDQRAMLSTAAALSRGILWKSNYLYSPAYTVFLSILVLLSGGEILIMRISQIFLCGLIPVFIYKTCRNLRLPFLFSQIASIIYCFYAASALIAMDFLRAAPLSLVFILYFYFLLRVFRRNHLKYYLGAGVSAALLVLGRENFIPVVFIPFIFLIFRDVRKRIMKKKFIFFLFSASMPVLFVCLVNLFRFNKFGILPGNAVNVISFYYPGYELSVFSLALWYEILSRCIVNLGKYLSSYEIPNSLSVYAHSDFSPMLNILIIPFNAIMIPVIFLPFLEKRKDVMLLFSLILGYSISMIIFEPFYRFRIPVVPLACTAFGGVCFYLSKSYCLKTYIVSIFILVLIFFSYENPQAKRTIGERKATIKILIENKLLSKAEKRINELAFEGYDVSGLRIFMEEKLKEDSSSRLSDSKY